MVRIDKLPLLLLLFFFFPTLVVADFVATVVAVSDGDSITVLSGTESHRVRLFSIDAPEKGQAYYMESKKALSSLVFGKRVTVIGSSHDAYGRLIGRIRNEAGVDVNAEMVRLGFAWWYRRYDPENALFRNLEAAAKKAGRGLWRDPEPIPPWIFRKGVDLYVPADAPVKKSRNAICHKPGGKYYHTVKRFKAFKTLAQCLASGGREPSQ